MKIAAVAVLTFLAVLSVLWFSRDVGTPVLGTPSGTVKSESVARELDPVTVVTVVEGGQERFEASSAEVLGPVAEVERAPEVKAGDLRVRVVDEAGEPLGNVPVAVFLLRPGSRSDRMRAVTDSGTGVATWVGAAVELGRALESSPGSTYEVGLHVPGLDLDGVPVDPAALPLGPLELTMPDYGSLEVRIRNAGGDPIAEHDHVFITPLFESPSEPGRLTRGERLAVRVHGRAEVSLPYVLTGHQLRVEVYDEGVRAGVHEDLAALRPGEHRVVTLVCRETLPHVTGRVVSADGEGIEARSLDVEFTPRGSARVELGPKGSFVLPLSRLRAEADGRFSAVLSVRLPGADGNGRGSKVLSGRFDAVVPPPEAPVNVGAVVLREPAVFVSGTVVDEEGEPVEDAYVSLYEKFNQREDPEDFGWNFAGIDYVHTDAGGRFEVTVDRPAGEYAIRAHADGFVDRGAVRFQSGTRDLVLPMDRERYLSGTLRLPDGVDPSKCRVVAAVLDATREEMTYARFTAPVDRQGAFTVAGLRPAAVRLKLNYGRDHGEVASLTGLLPGIDQDTAPAALDPWDVRDELRMIAFDVHLADGQPAPRALVAYGGGSLPVERGRVEALVSTAESDDVLVVAPGHRPTTLSARSIPKVVQLVRGIPVRIGIESALPALPDGAILTVRLSCETPSWLPWTGIELNQGPPGRPRPSLWIEEVAIDPGQAEWTVHVPSAGSYRINWTVRHSTDDNVLSGRRSRSFSTLTRGYEVEVEDGRSDGTLFWVKPDLERALEAMKVPD